LRLTLKVNAEFPEKLRMLFKLARYKVARGGRGSAKSWSYARALLIKGLSRRYRFLCAREIQRSIKDSVHKLLKDQIELMGLSSQYQVLETEIRGRNGTEFAFTGLSTLTVDTIKSFEGVDICWVEEGQTVSKRSWDILIPTIRKDDSEIWITYNPDLETDETHQRFTIHPPTDCINVEVNWRDNPWFNEVLQKERLHCKEYDPDSYDNIWEGKCRPAVEGAIYYKEIQQAEQHGRICNIPYDPLLRVHVVFDLGWEDSLGVALVQKNLSEIRLLEYLEASHTGLDVMSLELKKRPYNWGRVWLPHDGFAGSLNSGGKSSYDILKKLGWDVVRREEITELSIEEGIRQSRLIFGRVYFNTNRTHASKAPVSETPGFGATSLHWRLIECLKRYRRRVSDKTEVVGSPLKDPHAHGADCFRYVCINSDKMLNADERPRVDYSMANYEPLDAVIGM
jgi:phage terminase large subunit